MPHDARAIANEFIKRASRDGLALTNMQLQKLPYIAHGWSLALLNSPLIADEQPQAWPYGPVYPSLYESLRSYGSRAVEDVIRADNGSDVRKDLSNREKDLIEAVWARYRGIPAWRLSDMTHKDGTPWSLARQRGNCAPLNEDDIKQHYRSMQVIP